jgi:hypothetical protein
MSEDEVELCQVCLRELGDENIDRHHLIPKSRKGKEQFSIHRICHRKIHATFTEKELEKKYHTWEMIRAHEEISKFIEWVSKKPSGFYDGSDETKERNKKRRR